MSLTEVPCCPPCRGNRRRGRNGLQSVGTGVFWSLGPSLGAEDTRISMTTRDPAPGRTSSSLQLDCANMSQFRTLRWGDSPGVSGGLNVITRATGKGRQETRQRRRMRTKQRERRVCDSGAEVGVTWGSAGGPQGLDKKSKKMDSLPGPQKKPVILAQ